MVDVVDKATRSRMMSGIRSKNTKPEILTRKALHRLGYRYRLDSKIKLDCQTREITPDVVLRKHQVAVFAHGCYFHKHSNCKLAYSDRKYSESWLKKFEKNIARDNRVTKELLDGGWRVAVVWECGTRNKKEFQNIITQLARFIKSGKGNYFESQYKSQKN